MKEVRRALTGLKSLEVEEATDHTVFSLRFFMSWLTCLVCRRRLVTTPTFHKLLAKAQVQRYLSPRAPTGIITPRRLDEEWDSRSNTRSPPTPCAIALVVHAGCFVKQFNPA